MGGWSYCCQSDDKSCIIRADGDIGVHANDLFDSCDCFMVLAGEILIIERSSYVEAEFGRSPPF